MKANYTVPELWLLNFIQSSIVEQIIIQLLIVFKYIYIIFCHVLELWQ